jgi:hypothetical protein
MAATVDLDKQVEDFVIYGIVLEDNSNSNNKHQQDLWEGEQLHPMTLEEQLEVDLQICMMVDQRHLKTSHISNLSSNQVSGRSDESKPHLRRQVQPLEAQQKTCSSKNCGEAEQLVQRLVQAALEEDTWENQLLLQEHHMGEKAENLNPDLEVHSHLLNHNFNSNNHNKALYLTVADMQDQGRILLAQACMLMHRGLARTQESLQVRLEAVREDTVAAMATVHMDSLELDQHLVMAELDYPLGRDLRDDEDMRDSI